MDDDSEDYEELLDEDNTEVIFYQPDIVLPLQIMYKDCCCLIDLMERLDRSVEDYYEIAGTPKTSSLEELKMIRWFRKCYFHFCHVTQDIERLLKIINSSSSHWDYLGTKKEIIPKFEKFEEKIKQVEKDIETMKQFKNKCN